MIACKQGHLNCLEYFNNLNCPVNENMAIATAINGHLKCLQYLYSINCPMTEETLCSSIYFPQCVKFLIDVIYPITEKVCNVVAKNGKIECLMYLVERGLPHNETHVQMINVYVKNHFVTAENINEHLAYNIKFAFENAMPFTTPYILDSDIEEPKFLNNKDDIESIIKYNNENYLHHYSHNYPVSPLMIDYAVQYDNVKFLTILLRHKYPMSNKVLDIANKYNSENCLKILECYNKIK